MTQDIKKGYLIDTNVFSEIFRQEPELGDYSPIVDYFNDIPLNKRFTTDMNVLELYNRARSIGYKEIEKIDLFLKDEMIKIFPITRKDSKRALILMKKNTPAIGLEDKDALIAAISLNRNCHLITIDRVFEKLKKDGLNVITLAGYERGIINV
ncbi:MAG: PIN domain-containing protein [Thermoplasmatales archaeon]|nr:PIN domain-containing protein [Candidatus Methanoperedenaceae archaeon]MCG2826308.1 PIN domain-containing protein [Thermoplasmatales archaeon]